MPHDYDLAIIGGGMVGASLACALAPSGLRIAVIESIPISNTSETSYDDRGITLTPSSQRILQQLGVWQEVASVATSIKRIHVSEQARFGFTQINAAELNRQALGYVVVARLLGQALHKRMQEFDNITFMCPATLKHFKYSNSGVDIELECERARKQVNVNLMIGADGSHSLVRRLAGINTESKDFKQTAIVANVTTQKPNLATAFERFTPDGPVAFLPIDTHRSVCVFTVNSSDAESFMTISDDNYAKAIEKRFGRRLGRIEQIGQRRSYPISFMKSVNQHHRGLVLLGNAVHTVHPNAAQGFNLGLRDAAGLAEHLISAREKGLSLSDETMIQDYLANRRADQNRVVRFTNGLANTFYNRIPGLSLGRNLAMLLIDLLPELKSHFATQAMGLSGMQPALVREMS